MFDIINNNFLKTLHLKRVNKKKCKKCLTLILSTNKKRIFCSQSCATSFNNAKRRLSLDTINKIKKSLHRFYKKDFLCKIHILKCKKCLNNFVYNKKRKLFCNDCFPIFKKEMFSLMGKKSAQIQIKRSKKEKSLFKLLSKDFRCLNNKAIFFGWDADIIIPSLKLAILWNGVWHYKQLSFNNHKLDQVRKRDELKLVAIKKMGWFYIIVKDYDPLISPNDAYIIIKKLIKIKKFDITIQDNLA